MRRWVDAIAEPAVVAFWVAGVPRPQGRKSAITRHGRTVVVESGRKLLQPWRDAITVGARAAIAAPVDGPVAIELAFAMPRPATHYRGRDRARGLLDEAPSHHSHRPDLDKLTRAVLDALTGPAFVDDGQVAVLVATKAYGPEAGVRILLGPAA